MQLQWPSSIDTGSRPPDCRLDSAELAHEAEAVLFIPAGTIESVRSVALGAAVHRRAHHASCSKPCLTLCDQGTADAASTASFADDKRCDLAVGRVARERGRDG